MGPTRFAPEVRERAVRLVPRTEGSADCGGRRSDRRQGGSGERRRRRDAPRSTRGRIIIAQQSHRTMPEAPSGDEGAPMNLGEFAVFQDPSAPAPPVGAGVGQFDFQRTRYSSVFS